MRYVIWFFSAALISIFCCSETFAASRNCTKAEKKSANDALFAIEKNGDLKLQSILKHFPFGIPLDVGEKQNEELLVQSGYVMKHDLDLNTALWVGYRLTKEDILGAKGQSRVNCFRKDPRLENGGAVASDYREPIYDQGHLANDADLKDNKIEQINSYLYSNMSPQHCRFNRGIWLTLEHLTRSWAKKYGEVYVVSGAVFDANHDGKRDYDNHTVRMQSKNGKARVSVPNGYYKSILRKDIDGGYKVITFLLPNTNEDHGSSWKDVKEDVIKSIAYLDIVDEVTNLKLFPKIERSKIQESHSGEGWDFTLGRSNMSRTCK